MSAPLAHDWPGNVRELENATEHAMVCSRGGANEPETFPRSVVGGYTGPAQRAKMARASAAAADEGDLRLRALEASRWDRGLAAARLRIR
jgi:DNA-binding NtrC family response regulator